MDEKRFDELAMMVAEETTPGDAGITPADESMPRRAAMGLFGGLAGLAALATASRGASAQTTPAGRFLRIRQVVDSVNVPSGSNRVLVLTCPRAPSGQQVYVMGGGFNTTTNNPNFYIKTNAPSSVRSWVVDTHNTSGSAHAVGAYAICAYFTR